MTTPAPTPRLTPIPATSRSGSPTLPWRVELKVAVRDGYACRGCCVPLVADGDRRVVRLDPAGGDELENLGLLCERCSRAHEQHPQPLEPAHEQMEPLT